MYSYYECICKLCQESAEMSLIANHLDGYYIDKWIYQHLLEYQKVTSIGLIKKED
jgi:hypothetical protein